jgi:hypothetical protein
LTDWWSYGDVFLVAMKRFAMKRLFSLLLMTLLHSGCGLQVEVMKRQHSGGYTVDIYNKRNRISQHHNLTIPSREHDSLQSLTQEKAALHFDDDNKESINSILPTKPFAIPKQILQRVETLDIDSPRRDVPQEQDNGETIIEHPVPLITLFLSAAGLIALYALGATSGIFPSSGTLALVLIGIVLGSLSFMLFKKWRFKNAQPKGSAEYHAMDLLNVLLLSVLWTVLIGLLFLILIIVLLAAIFRNW